MVSVPHREQWASTPEPPLPKRKRVICPEYEITRGRESKRARASPWREREESEREHGEERVNSTVNEADSKEEWEGKQEKPP